MMEKDHPNRKERGNHNIQNQRRRDIPNPSTILQVQVPKRRIRESSSLTGINRIMMNPHA
jgi:hypothetical protein